MYQRALTKNTLFYGDNLDILRQYVAAESIDLIYLDPPFNSNRNYNVLYKEESGSESTSQIKAFEDTWHWNRETEEQYRALVARGAKLGTLLEALVSVNGRNQMTAYLVMMAIRLVELHRVLKPTGSLYLHCDPTASHYLKLVLDCLFEPKNYRNEVVWKRTSAHSDANNYGRIHDVILYYAKSEKFIWNKQVMRYEEKYLATHYRYVDEHGKRYDTVAMHAAGGNTLVRLFRGKELLPPPGTHWRFSQEKIDEMATKDLLVYGSKDYPRYKKYLDEDSGVPLQTIFSDISPINSQAAERLGYPTQKPLALLERIIQASSNPGDVILDPFCGCGTAVHAAQKLGRIWVGIDITPLATTLIKSRLYSAIKLEAKKDYDLLGEPVTLDDAKHLAQQDRYQFQWWALGLLPAYPYGGQGDSKQGKKGADKGIDGIMTFRDSGEAEKRIIVQVKSGKVSSRDLRDLSGTIEREKNAVLGVFITLEPPSRNMELEVLEIGPWRSTVWQKDYPKIQILTIEQLLNGAKVQFPGTDTTLKQAQREEPNLGEQKPLL